MLEVRNIAFSYAKKTILKDVSFSVAQGERIAIVGSNGSGKTTLIKLLATLSVPDSGTISFDNQEALSRSLRYRRMVGYLPERIALYDDMTVKAYLAYRAALKGEAGRRIRRRMNEAAQLCQITDILRTPISRLSNGLAKRVALADAIMLRPRILLLDDLLAGFDETMRSSIGSILDQVSAFSCVVATGHETEDFAKWAKRILVLKDGTIKAEIKTQDCDIAWEQIEFALDVDALGIGDIVGKISSDGQAKEMARAIIERCHEKRKFPDYELVFIKHYTQDNFWFFGYSIDQRNTAPEDLIDCGGFYVVIDGDGGTVIEAWVEE